MGYCLNRLTEPVFIAKSKLLLTEFGFHYRLESCEKFYLAWHLSILCKDKRPSTLEAASVDKIS